MGVVSGGECYSFPAGVACSVPVRCEGGEWEVVKDLQLPPAIQVGFKDYFCWITLSLSTLSLSHAHTLSLSLCLRRN